MYDTCMAGQNLGWRKVPLTRTFLPKYRTIEMYVFISGGHSLIEVDKAPTFPPNTGALAFTAETAPIHLSPCGMTTYTFSFQ